MRCTSDFAQLSSYEFQKFKGKNTHSGDGLLDGLESLLEEEGIELDDDDDSATAPTARAHPTSRSVCEDRIEK